MPEPRPPQIPQKQEKQNNIVTVKGLKEAKDLVLLHGINFMPPAEYIATNKSLDKKIYIDREADRVFFPKLPYAGINGYFVEMDSNELVDDTQTTFGLFRMHRVRQLGFLHGSFLESGYKEFVHGFDHTRLIHSYDAHTIASLMGHNLGLSPDDLKILQIAALSHDYRTPAGGDITKRADPIAFDEDKNYNQIFQTEQWKNFATKHKISKEQEESLYDVILGKGVLGQLLDLSDKLAYVSRDVDRYLNWDIRVMDHGKATQELSEIEDFVKIHPLVGSIWEEVKIVDGTVVIKDPEKLAHFLKLRALMWKSVYDHLGGGLSLEMFSQKLIKFLYDRGDLTYDGLLSMDDGELYKVLEKFTGIHAFPQFPLKLPHQSETFEAEEEAKIFAKKYNEDPDKIVIISADTVSSGPSTKKFFIEKDGKAVSFSEAYPTEAEEIEGIANIPRKVRAYVISLSDMGVPPREKKQVKKVFEV